MQVIVVGSGKLAQELLGGLAVGAGVAGEVVAWPGSSLELVGGGAVVVHAGSGRELDAVTAFCRATHSPLVELATGSALEQQQPRGFPVVLCPNTNILMLKFMAMVERSGALFRGEHVSLTESHQAQKSSVPGTAVSLARSLGLPESAIEPVRSAEVQRDVLQIPPEHLARHAYHQIVIEDGACRVALETRVYGDAPYVKGVGRIVAAVQAQPLEDRIYPVMEFVDNGWL